ncbi:MAG: 5-nitroimidazole antibiotic resistance protein, partial [Lachnospiraceae bacterium]|nr:5-nitroimidazole antibiotic resistance protein [Lachnospiraceae bacterium]
MFRQMRRSKQLLSKEDTEAVFIRNTVGVLNVLGDDGYPYGVPISYVYQDGKIYLHCAKEGHKIDAIRACDKVSFTVVDKNEVMEEEYTTYFRSAIAFGRIKELTTREE